jgi:flagellum-specific peptidoglycan hydrolase FlgJ
MKMRCQFAVPDRLNFAAMYSFRAYGSYDDAADYYAQMLRNNPRFRSSFLYTRSSQFANALAHNGYATDPSYAVKLNAIIRAHKLDQYDARRTEP